MIKNKLPHFQIKQNSGKRDESNILSGSEITLSYMTICVGSLWNQNVSGWSVFTMKDGVLSKRNQTLVLILYLVVSKLIFSLYFLQNICLYH